MKRLFAMLLVLLMAATMMPTVFAETAEPIEATTQATEAKEATPSEAEATAEPNQGQVLDVLDGDYAYLSSVTLSSQKSGTYEFDENDEPGNDSSGDNDILRTFDQALYTIRFQTQIRDEAKQQYIDGYRSGRIYFEFLLTASMEEARLETTLIDNIVSSMNGAYVMEELTLDEDLTVSANGDVVVLTKGTVVQVVRGSYVLETADGAAAIGASAYDLPASFRVTQMHNGETLFPIFTVWMQYNDLYGDGDVTAHYQTAEGAAATDWEDAVIPCDLAAGRTIEGDDDVVIDAGVIGKTMTVSAKPNYNVALVETSAAQVSYVADIDFGAVPDAPNADKGTVNGRLRGYGVRLEMLSLEEGKGMIGIEFPDEQTEISFDILFDTDLSHASKKNELNDYLPLFYDAAPNGRISEEYPMQYGRASHPKILYKYIPQIPFNNQPNSGYDNRCCYDGGSWVFDYDPENAYTQNMTKDAEAEALALKVSASISGIGIDPDLSACFPPTGFSSAVKYNVDPDKPYWMAEQAVLSAGQIYVVHPNERYDEDGNRFDIQTEFDASAILTIIYAGNLKVTEQQDDGTTSETTYGTTWQKLEYYNDREYVEGVTEGSEPVDERQSNETDDQYSSGSWIFNSGLINSAVYYGAYKDHTWGSALTEGCFESDQDWASEGQGVTPYFNSAHQFDDERFAGGAYDVLIKFDDTFFAPESAVLLASKGQTRGIFWAAKPDGTGWTDDEEMKLATADDLVFYASLDALTAAGAVPVAALSESRGVALNAEMEGGYDRSNQLYFWLDGRIRPDTADETYMVTFNYYIWTRQDVEEEALAWAASEYSEEEYLDENGALKYEYYDLYFKEGFPSKGDAATKLFDENADRREHGATGTGSYPTASFRQDAYFNSPTGSNILEDGKYIENQTDEQGYTGFVTCEKATYNGLQHIPGTGAPLYQDTCFVTAYNPTVEKSIAQTVEEKGEQVAKINYALDLGEHYVDYCLKIGFDRAYQTVGATTEDNTFHVSLCLEDTIPEGMDYLGGSATFGGTYVPSADGKSPGTVEGGLKVIDGGTAEAEGVKVTTTIEGKHITWLIDMDVTIEEGATGWDRDLYFTCQLQPSQLANGDSLINNAKIYRYEDESSGSDQSYGGRYSDSDMCSLTIVKLAASAIEKSANPIVADLYQDQQFTMTVTNSGGTTEEALVVDTLPYNGSFNSSFHGELLVKEFALTGNQQAEMAESMAFYYTTDVAYKDCRSSTLTKEEITSGWTQLVPDETDYSFELPADQTKQIIAIAAVGEMAVGATLNMTITLNLPNGLPSDRLVNYLSSGTLETYARSEIVNRAIEGRVWLDPDRDGSRAEMDRLTDGVTVSLLKLNAEGSAYEPVCYNGTNEPVQVLTGQQVSLNGGEAEPFERGSYRFNDLLAGTYAVQFTDGTGIRMAFYTVSPKDADNDTHDSDAVGKYNEKTLLLESAVIEGIVMPTSLELKNGMCLSADNDLGLYKFVELLGAQAHIVVSPKLEVGQRPTEEHEALFTNGIRFGYEIDRLTLQGVMEVGDRFNTGFLLQTVDKLNTTASNTDYNAELMEIAYGADGAYTNANSKGNQQVFAAKYDVLMNESAGSYRTLNENTMIEWTQAMEDAATAEELALLLEAAGLCVFGTSDTVIWAEDGTSETTGTITIMTYIIFGDGNAKAKADREIAYRAFLTVYDASENAFVTEYSLQKANCATRIFEQYIGTAFNGASVAAPGAEGQLQ